MKFYTSSVAQSLPVNTGNGFALPPRSCSEFKRPKVTYDFVTKHREDHEVENPKGASVHDISESLLIDAETVDIPGSVVQMTNRSFSSARVRLRGCRICQHSKPVRMKRKVYAYYTLIKGEKMA